ncbi:hypothetical protein Tco_1064427 [Tanacetum coccineum]
MANLPSPNHDANVPEDEPANLKPAPIIPNHASVQPDGYLSDVEVEDDVKEEDPKEEPEKDEPMPEPNNMNRRWKWMRMMRRMVEMMMRMMPRSFIHMRRLIPSRGPPPTSDEESEFAPHVVPVIDANNEPIPLVIQFGCNFHVGESSSNGLFL